MPKGPPGQRPPSDVITAVQETPITTGDAAADMPSPTSAAAQLGKLGGAARARNLTPEQRTEIAKKAAARRWEKK